MIFMSPALPVERASITIGDDGAVHCSGPSTIQHLPDLERALAGLSWPRLRELIFQVGLASALRSELSGDTSMDGLPCQDVDPFTGSGPRKDRLLASGWSDADIRAWQLTRGDRPVTASARFSAEPSPVRIALRIQMIKLPDYLVLATRLFNAVEEASTEDAYGGAVAANQAANKLVSEVAGWLSGCVSVGQRTGCPQ